MPLSRKINIAQPRLNAGGALVSFRQRPDRKKAPHCRGFFFVRNPARLKESDA